MTSNLVPRVFSFSNMAAAYWKTRKPWGRGCHDPMRRKISKSPFLEITVTAILYIGQYILQTFHEVFTIRNTEDVLVVKTHFNIKQQKQGAFFVLKWIDSTKLASLLVFNTKVFIPQRAADVGDYQIIFSFTIKLSKLTIYKRTL